MDRRLFLQSLAAATSVAAMPGALAHFGNVSYDGSINWAAGWQGVKDRQFAPLEMTLSGSLPKGIDGTLFRNGPALTERAGVSSHHWFDGDGMVQRYAIRSGKIIHQGKMVHTERYLKEEQAQRFLYQQAGTPLEEGLPARNNDTTNQANIAILPWNDEILALWEGGSAYRINPTSLETLGRKDWRDDLVHMPFSAHPLPDKNGRVWNIGFAPYAGKTGMMFIYELFLTSGVKRVQPVTLPFAGYIHDFAQTEQHLIFLVPPYHYQHHNGQTFVSRFKWQPELGSRLLIVNKNDLTRQKWFELPAGFVFHFGNAWCQRDVVGVNICWYDDPTLMQSTRQDRINDQHRPLHQQAMIKTVFANLNTGQLTEHNSDIVMEFPSFDETAFSMRTDLLGVGVTERNGVRADTLTSYSLHSGVSQHYRYPAHIIAEEPVEVASSYDGKRYVVQTYMDIREAQTGLHVFERNRIADGPIVDARMNRRIPLGFHGAYVRS